MSLLEFLRIYDGYHKNMVKADRQGDFLLHIKSIGDLLPIFLGCDGINYLRNGTFYWEQLKGLRHQHPELYESLLQGGFSMKTKAGSFNAVGIGFGAINQ